MSLYHAERHRTEVDETMLPINNTLAAAMEKARKLCYYGDPHGSDCRICQKIARDRLTAQKEALEWARSMISDEEHSWSIISKKIAEIEQCLSNVNS